MQPQESGGFDLWHALSGLIGTIIGTAASAVAWIYRAGGAQPKFREEIRDEIAAVEKRMDDKLADEIDHFRETLNGLREQINRAVTRDDLALFRKEIREDFLQHRKESREDAADLKKNIAEIIGRRARAE